MGFVYDVFGGTQGEFIILLLEIDVSNTIFSRLVLFANSTSSASDILRNVLYLQRRAMAEAKTMRNFQHRSSIGVYSLPYSHFYELYTVQPQVAG